MNMCTCLQGVTCELKKKKNSIHKEGVLGPIWTIMIITKYANI